MRWASVLVMAASACLSLAQDEGPAVQDPGQAGGQAQAGSQEPGKTGQIPPLKNLPPVKPGTYTKPPGANITKVPTSVMATPDKDAAKKKKKNTLGSFIAEQVLKRIQISGSRRFGYHSHVVQGDQEAFNLATTYGLGEKRWTDIGSITLQGRQVLGVANFDAVIQDNRFQDPQGQKFSINYEKNGLKIDLGDIQGRLMDSNRFVSFSRTVRGAMAGYKKGMFEARALLTEARGEARTVTVQGSNTSGPYFLQSNQILRGSETIEVDGVPQSFGQDYTIDYDLGAISFVNRSTGQARIIPPTSVITATYESYSLSGGRGRIMGVGTGLDFGRYGRIGLSAAAQRAGGSSRLSTRIEKFQGFGAPGTPYVLQFEPLSTEPVIIRVDGVLQTENLDYTLDPDNPSIFYFTRYMPPASEIDVVYTPRPTQTVNGDRQVVGIDYRLGLAKGTTLSLAEATSRLTNTPTPKEGTARSIELRHERGRATAVASFRIVPDTYAGIETTGFNRNETSSLWSLSYLLRQGLSSGIRWQNSAVSQITYDSSGNEKILPTRMTTASATLALAPSASGIPWSLTQSRTSGSNASGETQVDSTTLGFTRNAGRLQTRWELNNQFGASPTGVAGDPRQKFTRQGIDLNGGYTASDRVTATFSAGLSRVALEDSSGTGRDYQLGLVYRPAQETQVGLTYSDSSSGGVSQISGYTSGYGLGYNGNGFSAGGGTPINGVSSLRRLALTGRFRPSSAFSFSAAAAHSRSQGAVSSDSEVNSFTLTGDWDMGRWLQISGTTGLSSSRSLNTGTNSRAVTYAVTADGAPKGRISYGFGFSGLLSTGGDYAQNTYQSDARLSYRLARRHSLAFDWYSAFTTGYQPQDEYSVGLAYRYEFLQGIAFSVGHRWRRVDNRNSTESSGAYRSHGFDLELAFTFGR